MREFKEIDASSYRDLKSSIKSTVETLEINRTIEAISMMYDSNGNSSHKYKAIIVIK